MKNLISLSIIALVAACLFTACEKEQLTESENLELRRTTSTSCPRQDIEIDGPSDFDDVVDELNAVVGCGGAIASLDCGSDVHPISDQTGTIVREFCYTTSPGSCDCVDIPNNFTIADQDQIIVDARTLLNNALTSCNITNDASITFFAEVKNVPTCEDIRIRLFARALVECCPK